MVFQWRRPVGLLAVLLLILALSSYKHPRHYGKSADPAFRQDVIRRIKEIEKDLRKESSASDTVGAIRDLPDTRNLLCKGAVYDLDDSGKVSVIISFHNEGSMALVRTIASVLIKTPEWMLEEIILIDDATESGTDGRMLLGLPKVRLVRNSERQGLIRSRALGAEMSSGKYLMFLDSHCEVNRDWLQPLVENLLRNKKSIACPLIDAINPVTYDYNRTSDHLKAGFDWSFRFKWIQFKRNEGDISQPYISPITAGGIFLIEKEWFITVGMFDTGLEIWGTESIEISIKTWLCGGSLRIVPCSRVGHVFQKKHSYSFPLGNAFTYLRNAKRIAEVWLGEYKTYFFLKAPGAVHIDAGRLDEQLAIKKSLDCKPFEWYLENIFPELSIPIGGDNSAAYGQLKQGNNCLLYDEKLSSAKRESEGKLAVIKQCQGDELPWRLTPNGEIKSSKLCLTAVQNRISVHECNGHESQKWVRNGRSLKAWINGLCLDALLGEHITLSECRQHAPTQYWDFSVELQDHRMPLTYF